MPVVNIKNLKKGDFLKLYDRIIKIENFDYSISKNLSIGISNDIIIQTYTSFINPKIKPFDSNLNLYFKASI
jgi:16S rRNA U1498 N3-methylase RsmE